MKYLFLKYYFGYLMLYLPFAAFGQWGTGQATVYLNFPEVALVDIEPETNNQIHFAIQPAQEAGQSALIEKSADAALWINYTSAMSVNQNSRSITVAVSQGQIPSGIKLFLVTSEISGGNGRCGVSTGKTELSNQPRPIITGIGNCFTGDGINNGHQISLSIEISDYPALKSTGESNFIVLYTLTDN